MSKRICTFDESWKMLQYEKEDYIDKFDVWLIKGKNSKAGFCKLCNRSIAMLKVINIRDRLRISKSYSLSLYSARMCL